MLEREMLLLKREPKRLTNKSQCCVDLRSSSVTLSSTDRERLLLREERGKRMSLNL